MVGFNRRFAPSTEFIKAHFTKTQTPINTVYRINAGKVPHGNWVTSAEEGGGRIVGEVCHFVDLCSFLASSRITQVSAARGPSSADEVMVNLRLANGSVATVAYLIDGDPASPKERIELFGGGATGVIEDFRRATLSVNGGREKFGRRLGRQDKGHRAEMAAFVSAVGSGSPSPVPFEDAENVTRATFAVLAAIERNTVVDV
jgi:predicted dehydrogenase